MSKAFIFDMDGVIVDTETIWARIEPSFLPQFFGKEIYEKIKDRFLGNTLKGIYDLAVNEGFGKSRDEYYKLYDEQAKKVHPVAKITNGIDELVELLLERGFVLGLVSSSRMNWIDMVLDRLIFSDKFKYIVSVNDRDDLRSKPDPDGYLEAMKKLKVKPQDTIIIEDSNTGIKAAKASGALVICLKENHFDGYQPMEADIYIEKLSDLTKILKLLENNTL